MYLALDVQYSDSYAVGASVAFADRADEAPAFVIRERFEGAPLAYEPGNFKQRELPYLLALVRAAESRPCEVNLVLIDGYVWLGKERPGLGFHLFEALGRTVPIIGVAKSRFVGAPAVEVLRGRSTSPLFVTAIGLDQSEAEAFVRLMHGPHRIPTLLRSVDRLSRTA